MRLLVRRSELETPHFPPISAVPILEHYDSDIGRLSDEFLLAAPVDDRGVVKVFDTIDTALAEVDPSYRWPNQECDVHHFVWRWNDYKPIANEGSLIPMRYREIAFQKGYLPRQLHNLLHAIIAEPQKPTLEVMEGRVVAYHTARHLFKTAKLAAKYNKDPQSFLTAPRKKWRSLNIEEAALSETIVKIRESYSSRFDEEIFQNEEMFDLQQMSQDPMDKVATYLGRFAAISEINLNPYIAGDRPSFMNL